MRVSFLTANYYNDYVPTQPLIRSATRHSIEFVAYGLKKHWNNHKETKIDGLLEALRDIDADIIVYCDGADSCVMKPFDSAYFDSLNTDFLFSHEKNAYPHPIQLKSNICAGQFIAKAKPLVKALEYMSLSTSSDDQGIWQEYLQNYDSYEVDTNHHYFVAMGDYSKDDLTDDLRFKKTGEYPFSYHFNGGKGGENGNLMLWMFQQIGVL